MRNAARRLDPDHLNNVDRTAAGEVAMGAISAAQIHPPAARVVGMTAAFKLMLERYGITPSEAFEVTNNVINGAAGRMPEFAAVGMYLKKEM